MQIYGITQDLGRLIRLISTSELTNLRSELDQLTFNEVSDGQPADNDASDASVSCECQLHVNIINANSQLTDASLASLSAGCPSMTSLNVQGDLVTDGQQKDYEDCEEIETLQVESAHSVNVKFSICF